MLSAVTDGKGSVQAVQGKTSRRWLGTLSLKIKYQLQYRDNSLLTRKARLSGTETDLHKAAKHLGRV